MKAHSWLVTASFTGLVIVWASAAWADDGRPSRATLDAMGLSGLEFLSDSAAQTIRGQGYSGSGKSSARVFGSSFATINTRKGTAHSENGYSASGKHFAAGANGSFAGATFKKSSGGHYGGRKTVKSVKVFAGGFSWAKAF